MAMMVSRILTIITACLISPVVTTSIPTQPQPRQQVDSSSSSSILGPDSSGKYTISAPGIRASFIPYGASISNLYINSTSGKELDIILGFDNATYYTLDKQHPHLGGVPGRYANRIKNSSFTIDGTEFHVLPNENPTAQFPEGVDTLHGGPDGWDWRNFTVETHTHDSITFSIFDGDGNQGFPGDVVSYITYTVTENTWHIKMVAESLTKKTPIMLSSHTYWNLDGFEDPDTPLVLNHSLWLPYSGQRIETDSILIPTGNLLGNELGGANDFWSGPREVGRDFGSGELVGQCGAGCLGYDTAYLVNRGQLGPYDWEQTLPVARLSSAYSGIQLDVYSDQDAFQIYTCSGQNGSLALKNTQGLFGDDSRPRVVEKYGCLVMEVEDWIDGINQPEWMRGNKQVFGPADGPYVLEAKYVFSQV